MQDGTVKAFGDNSLGQLGTGVASSYVENPVVVNVANVKQVICGTKHSVFLGKDGTMKVVGQNNFGQLGLGNTTNPQLQIQTSPLSNVKQVACGDSHTVVLLNDGTVRAMGNNGQGQLGINSTALKTSPQDVGLTGVKAVSCGLYTTMFLMNDGTVKACGMNTSGQLGVSDTSKKLVPIDIGLTGVKQVSCGANHTMFLMNDGIVKVAGNNAIGQLGTGDKTSSLSIRSLQLLDVKEVCAGYNTTFFLMKDGTVKACGTNGFGELGLGNTIDNQGVIKDLSIKDVKSISPGKSMTIFLDNTGQIKGVGGNDLGQLGTNDIISPKIDVVLIPIGKVEVLQNVVLKLLKMLIKTNDTIKNFQSGSWIDVGTIPITKELFNSFGMNDFSSIPSAKWLELIEPEVIAWTEEKGEKLNLSVKGIPTPEVFVKEEATISELTSIRSVDSNNGIIRIAISKDGGETWNGNGPVDLLDSDSFKENGYKPSDLNLLTGVQLEQMSSKRKVMVSFYLEQEDLINKPSISKIYVTENKYTGTPKVSSLKYEKEYVMPENPLIEMKDKEGNWNEISLDKLHHAPVGHSWEKIELRVRLKGDQQLNAIAYSWI